MSETNIAAVSTQAEAVATTETAQQTPEQVQVAVEEARKATAATLKACTTAFRKAEREFGRGMLEAGCLAAQYIAQRLALGDKREAAVQAIEGQLAAYASTTVDANELVACYRASELLGTVEQADAVPYGHFRDGYRQLVQRQGKDTPEECWVLLPGMEEECKALYAKHTADKLSLAAVRTACKDVQRAYAAKVAEQAKADRLAVAKAKLEAEQATAKALEDVQAKAVEEQRVKAALNVAKEEDKAALTERMTAVRQQIQEAQEKAIASHAETTALAAKEVQAVKVEKATAVKADKAKAKAVDAAEKAVEKAKATPVTGNLLQASAKAGQPKDVASMAASMVEACTMPDDCLEALLTILSNSKQLSRRAKGACADAVTAIQRKHSPSPVQVAGVCGNTTVIEPAAVPA